MATKSEGAHKYIQYYLNQEASQKETIQTVDLEENQPIIVIEIYDSDLADDFEIVITKGDSDWVVVDPDEFIF